MKTAQSRAVKEVFVSVLRVERLKTSLKYIITHFRQNTLLALIDKGSWL
jgi:hypothetical protein